MATPRKKYDPAYKAKVLAEAKRRGPAWAARKFRLSVHTIWQWQRRAKAHAHNAAPTVGVPPAIASYLRGRYVVQQAGSIGIVFVGKVFVGVLVAANESHEILSDWSTSIREVVRRRERRARIQRERAKHALAAAEVAA